MRFCSHNTDVTLSGNLLDILHLCLTRDCCIVGKWIRVPLLSLAFWQHIPGLSDKPLYQTVISCQVFFKAILSRLKFLLLSSCLSPNALSPYDPIRKKLFAIGLFSQHQTKMTSWFQQGLPKKLEKGSLLLLFYSATQSNKRWHLHWAPSYLHISFLFSGDITRLEREHFWHQNPIMLSPYKSWFPPQWIKNCIVSTEFLRELVRAPAFHCRMFPFAST